MNPIPIEQIDPELATLIQYVAKRNSVEKFVRITSFGDVFHWRGFWDEIHCEIKIPNRNDPCYCNSGKKFKKCCGK